MSIRQLFWVASVALAFSAGAQELPTPPTQALTLVQALQAARQQPEVALARQALAAARADIQSANHAPLPVFSTKAASIDLQNGIGAGGLGRKRIDKALGMDWTWERGDKRALRTLGAEQVAAAARADVADVQAQALQVALAAFYELLAAQQRLDSVAALADSAAELARVARRRVQAGDVSAQDADRTDIEAQRAQAERLSAERELARARLALAQVLGTPADLPAWRPEGDWPAAAPAESVAVDVAAWVDARPEVQAATARVRAAEALLAGALALRKTDVTLGASVNHFPGTSNRMLEFRLQMPLQMGYAYEGEIARAQAQLTQAEQQLDRIRQLVALDLARLRQDLVTALQRLARLEDGVLPQARRVADRAELAYAKGALSLTDLLDARRTLRATLLEVLAARADHAKAWGAWRLRTQPEALGLIDLSPAS